MSKIFVLFLLIVSSKNGLGNVLGTEVDISERPYQVVLNQISIRTFFVYCNCGGVIISKNYVLTAAHCVDNKKIYIVRAGSSQCWNGTVYEISRITIHPNFTRTPPSELYRMQDLAILEMAKEIQFTEFVQPIKMAEKGFNARNLFVEISGYGRICNRCPRSLSLSRIEMKTLSMDDCQRLVTNQFKNMLCHVDNNFRSTICDGDSGGPVTVRRGTEAILLGVVSGGARCLPAALSYSSIIPDFRDWIKSITNL